ncbi:MAG: primosomal protein N' [SAR324 cluster bacterium]|nr:primosomal protein N' [SAR324 cluster bacterium]HIO61585.1 primosomal protein N' [Deltaproteobacteria bacterium]
MIVEVALNLPLRNTFDYRWPDNLARFPEAGLQVLVPFGSQKKGGVVVGVKEHSSFARLKQVETLVDEEPLFSAEMLELTKWTSEYYFCAWGETLNAAIPGGLTLRLRTTFTAQSNSLPQLEKLSELPLSLIRSQAAWTQQEWLKCNPDKHDHQLLRRWLANGDLRTTHVFLGQKAKPKMERWVCLLKPDEAKTAVKRRKTKRQHIFEILKENPKICWSDIQNRVNAPSHILKKLKEEGFVDFFEKRIYRRFMEGGLPEKEPFQALNPEQKFAFDELSDSLKKGAYRTFLLEGVTGSGKTEVYLHAVRAARNLGKSSLVLVPEISLTPQLVNRFRSRFGDLVAVLHSGMDDGERFDEWSRVRNGIATIVIGARSAVFSPLKNLGLIVIDEEHDPSYKQGESPRYHGRDTAIYRGFAANATVLLGSATPSLESANNVNNEKYELLRLTSRIHQVLLPEVKLLDMKTVQSQKGSPYFSSELVESLRLRLLKKEQSIVFLNRRGFAPLVRCSKCETTYTCPNCSLSLVYHQAANQVRCHQCDFIKPLQNRCPDCGTDHVPIIIGTGTEQVEENLKMFFPEARILRMDRDTLHGKHALSKMHDRIRKHEVDIVIGTQLVTKGHDFPEVTLVGVILSDLSLNIPDFRASERTFQLLTQVAGRAGRGHKPGKVLIQTHNPRHHSLLCAKEHDTTKFRELELERRQNLRMPPFHSLSLIVCSSPREERAESIARELAEKIQKIFSQTSPVSHAESNSKAETIEVIGPIEAPMKKLRNRFRWQLLLKAENVRPILHLLKLVFESAPSTRRDELIQIDVDPHNLL